jgi:CheY-like chemotaxis protein
MSIKVLITDASKDVRNKIKDALLSTSFDLFEVSEDNILEANDGLEAFGLIGKHTDIKYFFSDVDMKHLKGDELLEVLLDTGKLNDVKVVFISDTDITKKLPTNLKKYVLGTILKPFKVAQAIDTLKKLIVEAKERESKEKEASLKAEEIQVEQKVIIKNIVDKYYRLSKFEKEIDYTKLDNIIDIYINPEEFIPSEELMVIIPPIMSEFLIDMEVNAKVDNYKLQFLFDNQLIEIKEESSENKKDAFVANLMNDENMPNFEFGDINLEDMVKNIETVRAIETTLEAKDVTIKRFEPIIKNIKKEQASLSDVKNSLDYIRMKHFMFKAYEMLTDMDFTIDNKDLKDTKKKIEQLVSDIEYFVNFRDKNSAEYHFVEIYSLYQKEYQMYKYAAEKMFENRDANKKYRTVIEKLDKMLKGFEKTETKTFYNMFSKQLQKIIVAYLDLLNKYTYKFDSMLWKKARESNSIKNFFREKRIPGSMCTKALLSYYVKINKVSDDEKDKYTALVAMLEKSNPRNVVYISNNSKESSIIETAVGNVDTNWKLYTLAKLSLIDSWFKGNDLPDILIIDANFDLEVENAYELLKWLYKKYPKVETIQSQMLMAFDKVNIDAVEKASEYGIREYIKRPFVEAEIRNKLRFM